ncbi:sigma-70 family RNA polymerase sigma factor [Propioniciclava sp. MC1683]|uniref:sigma-70 family RNA polymerase sigma factor n=1 Tax=Propioniciclava sp. MC1683 TaxID=2760309 RepID=UPI0035CCD9AE
MKTYLAWSRVRHDDALAYARRILVNASVDAWRKRHGEVVSDEAVAAHEPVVASGFEQVEEHDRVGRMLATLPPQQRRVVVLRYYADLSEREVADQLGLSLGTVKSNAARGVASLRARYAEEGLLS